MISGRVLITGITGLIGGKIAESLLAAGCNVEITGVTRNASKAKALLGELYERVKLLEGDIADENFVKKIKETDYIFHCAAITDSKKMVETPVEVADTIVCGTRNILSYAKKCNAKGVVFLSSMEVYGVVDDIGRGRLEDEIGTIDLTSPRSSYPMAKRTAEHYCHIYCTEYGVPVKVARLSQVFGRGVRESDNRVYMQFARSAVEEKDIVLETLGQSIGNYCDINDAVNAILLIMEAGGSGEVYNVVNEANTLSIREMAELVAARICRNRIKVVVNVKDSLKTGYAPDTGLRMSSQKLRKLGWTPERTLEQMYQDVIQTIIDRR